MKKLERLADEAKFVGILSLYLAFEIIMGFSNGVYQQAKHLGYHLGNINHKREDCPSDSSFPYYARLN